MIFRVSIILVGIILLLTMRFTEEPVTRLIELFSFRKADTSSNRDNEEDDILSNKTKWRLIISGYVIFILFAIFAMVSIFTLNKKINTLYGSIQNLEETVQEMQAVYSD